MILYPMLAAVLFLSSLGIAEDAIQRPHIPQQNSLTGEKRTDKPSSPILDQVFGAGLNQDQLKTLGGHPTLEQQAAAMTPEQKIKVRQGLQEEEAKAKTPEDLKQIARGYLILDEHQIDAGQNAVRVAVQLQKLNPENSSGFTLAAGGYYQMNNFQAAAQAAEEALRRDPKDPNAITVYALSRDRIGIREINSKAVEKSFPFAAVHDDPNLPIKLPVKMPGRSVAVPLMTSKDANVPERRGSSPLLPITVPLGAGLIGYGIYRSRQPKVSEAGINPEPAGAPTSGAIMTNTIIKAAIGATAIVGAGFLAAPYFPVLLSVSEQAAPALAGSGAAGSTIAIGRSAAGVTKAGVAAGGAAVAAKVAALMASDSKNPGGSSQKQASGSNAGGDKDVRQITRNFKEAVRRLKVDEQKASDALHKAKKSAGRKGANNVEFDTKNGDIRSPETGEVIGNLFD